MIGALREIAGYDDLLMSTLDLSFSPETRGSIAFSLGRGLLEAASEPETPFYRISKDWFIRYWAAHAERLGGQDGSLLENYLLWLSDVSVHPSEIADLVETSIARAEDSFLVSETFRYAKAYVEDSPNIVLRILDRCVEWYRLHGDFWLEVEDVQSLLYRIAPLISDSATLREVVEGFTELGALTTDDVRTILSLGPTEPTRPQA